MKVGRPRALNDAQVNDIIGMMADGFNNQDIMAGS